MRERTAALHGKAERTGVVHALITGRATRAGYALFLRNLLPAYRRLEEALAQPWNRPEMRALDKPEIARAGAIESDLASLAGEDWERTVPLLPEGDAYARRISTVACGDGSPLIAHAYARYLGDLAGGRILRRCVGESLGLPPECLSFYDFPRIADPRAFAQSYRAALDGAAAALSDPGPVLEEAAIAFQLNIELSEAVQHAATPDASSAPHG